MASLSKNASLHFSDMETSAMVSVNYIPFA